MEGKKVRVEHLGLAITAVKELRSQKSGAKSQKSAVQESRSPGVQESRSQESGVRSQETRQG